MKRLTLTETMKRLRRARRPAATLRNNAYYWMAPDGTLFPVMFTEHADLAAAIGTTEEDMYRMSFARVGTDDWDMEVCASRIRPKQWALLSDWCFANDRRSLRFIPYQP